jgi:hypothetical protein
VLTAATVTPTNITGWNVKSLTAGSGITTVNDGSGTWTITNTGIPITPTIAQVLTAGNVATNQNLSGINTLTATTITPTQTAATQPNFMSNHAVVPPLEQAHPPNREVDPRAQTNATPAKHSNPSSLISTSRQNVSCIKVTLIPRKLYQPMDPLQSLTASPLLARISLKTSTNFSLKTHPTYDALGI